ncbi:hypothetical protein AZE42_10906 [Rhizopogon vesiculosus]|uniref:Uncharacterized protein n=1 Tax=Rhizopogon vesiculosus TaxID=180088 RepID=A0A1J8QJ05_9AGAM|nr:hypothetical protein AZE42_10906 [Rhizopogon vesiculosus]
MHRPCYLSALLVKVFTCRNGQQVITHALEGMFQASTIPLDAIHPLYRRKFYVATRAIAQRRHLLLKAREIWLDGALTSRTHIDRPHACALKRSPPVLRNDINFNYTNGTRTPSQTRRRRRPFALGHASEDPSMHSQILYADLVSLF